MCLSCSAAHCQWAQIQVLWSTLPAVFSDPFCYCALTRTSKNPILHELGTPLNPSHPHTGVPLASPLMPLILTLAHFNGFCSIEGLSLAVVPVASADPPVSD